MKIHKKKLLQWSFWPVLLLLIIGGYFWTRVDPKNEHLNQIPKDVSNVVLVDLWKIITDYESLLEENPLAADQPLGDYQDLILEMFQVSGINPFQKLGIYFFTDSMSKVDFMVVCAAVISTKDYINVFNPKDEKAITENYKGATIHFFETGKQAFLEKDNFVFVLQPLTIDEGKLDLETAKIHFEKIMTTNDKLVGTDEKFKALVQTTNHIAWWSNNKKDIPQNQGIESINYIANWIEEQQVSINLESHSLSIKGKTKCNTSAFSITTTNSCDAHKESNALDLPLQFAIRLNPKTFLDYFRTYMPSEKSYLLNEWTGGLYVFVSGFQDVLLRKVISDSIFDGQGMLQAIHWDSIPAFASDWISLPKMNFSIELDPLRGAEMIKKIDQDTSIIKIGEGKYYFELPELIRNEGDLLAPQRIYLEILDHYISFSDREDVLSFPPCFTTIYLNCNIQSLVNAYLPKSMLDMTAIKYLSRFDIERISIRCTKTENEWVHWEGNITMNDKTINHLLQFPKILLQFQ